MLKSIIIIIIIVSIIHKNNLVLLSHIYNFFEKKKNYKCRLYAKEFGFGKNSSMKRTIYLVSFLMYVIFHITPGLLFPKVGV